MQKLVYTRGSPGSRAVRIALDELGVQYESVISEAGASADVTPAMQVPCLVTDGRALWETPLIIDYLLSEYGPPRIPQGAERALAEVLHRPEHSWEDKLAMASIQTFGTSVATISQMRWSGVEHKANEFLHRCAERIEHLLDWYEGKISGGGRGLFVDRVAIQDVLLVCWLAFIDHRPLDLSWQSAERPRIAALFDVLTARGSFIRNPIEWWEPAA